MSRGRKAKSKSGGLSWQQFFIKNVGKYLLIIISELSSKTSSQNETGAALLEEIKKKKKKLIEEKKIKQEKPLATLKEEEIPFHIPKNWAWCRLGMISINCDGERNPISQSEREGREKIYDYYGASGVIDKIDGFTHDGKFLLIGEDGANLIAKSTPIAFIAEGKFWVNNHAHVLNFVDDITMEFMRYCLNAIDINPFITGGFQPKLSQGNLNLLPIPLPPLSEQVKIVNFLNDFGNENLKSVGSYFNAEVEQNIIRLHKSQLSTSEIFSELTHQQDLVKQLRQSFLRDAMQGKLVKQNSKDGNAKDLLEEIKAEKAKLDKKEKVLAEIKEGEIPFDIPENWNWCRFEQVTHISKSAIRRGPFGSSITKMMFVPKSKNATKVYEQKNAIYKNYELGDYYINLDEHPNLKSFFVSPGEIIISCAGTIGETYILPQDAPIGIINQALLKIKLNASIIVDKFFLLVFQSLIKDRVNEDAKGSAMKNLGSINYLKENLIIPLPPLPEQNRIVNKLEELMKLCDDLQASIQDSKGQNEMLLQGALRDALRPKELTTQTTELTNRV